MNKKALSPVVASIILIAIVVAVSIAIATWTGVLTFDYHPEPNYIYMEEYVCDKIIINPNVTRVNVNDTVSISYHFKYAKYKIFINNTKISSFYINGLEYTLQDDWCNITVSYDTVGSRTFMARPPDEYTYRQLQPDPIMIWDKIIVTSGE